MLFKHRLDQAEEDDAIKVVVLVAEGKDFCSGDDVRRLPVEKAGLEKGSGCRRPRSSNARRLHRRTDQLAGVPQDRRRGLSRVPRWARA